MSVTIATRVFGSELLVALIRHFHESPSSQREAAEALNVPRQLVSTSTRILLDAGVLVEKVRSSGRRAGRYGVDIQRLDELLAALGEYSHGR